MRPILESETLATKIATNYREIHQMLKKTDKKSFKWSFPNVEGGLSEAIQESFP